MTQRLQLGLYQPTSEDELLLPGVKLLPANLELNSWVDWSRYVADESLRRAVNALYARGQIVVTARYVNPSDDADVPNEFPIATEAELEAKEKPIVPEMGQAYILAVEPDDEDLATGQAAIWVTHDVFHGSTMKFKAKGQYAQLVTDEGLVYTAKKCGLQGDNISIQHVHPEEDNAVASVVVEGKQIAVNLPTSADAVAASAFMGTGDAELQFVAKTPGAAGNSLRVVYNEGGLDEVGATTADVDGSDVEVTLAQTAEVHASVILGAGNSAIKVTRLNNDQQDANLDGASIFNNNALADPEFEFTGALYMRLQVNSGVTTAQELVDYMATVDASDYLDNWLVELAPGSDGTGAVAQDISGAVGPNLYYHQLSGGSSAAITATAAAVKAAIEADSGANALVGVSLVGNGTGVVDDDSSVGLTGGADADSITATAGDVLNMVLQSADAMRLVSVELETLDAGDNPAEGMNETNLSGGDNNAIFASALSLDN